MIEWIMNIIPIFWRFLLLRWGRSILFLHITSARWRLWRRRFWCPLSDWRRGRSGWLVCCINSSWCLLILWLTRRWLRLIINGILIWHVVGLGRVGSWEIAHGNGVMGRCRVGGWKVPHWYGTRGWSQGCSWLCYRNNWKYMNMI